MLKPAFCGLIQFWVRDWTSCVWTQFERGVWNALVSNRTIFPVGSWYVFLFTKSPPILTVNVRSVVGVGKKEASPRSRYVSPSVLKAVPFTCRLSSSRIAFQDISYSPKPFACTGFSRRSNAIVALSHWNGQWFEQVAFTLFEERLIVGWLICTVATFAWRAF